MKQLYLLTVNYNSSDLISRLIRSLPQENLQQIQTLVVNNSPADKNIHKLADSSIEIIDAQGNLGFGKACNLGLQKIYAQNPLAIVWLINPDTYFATDLANLSDQTISFFNRYPQISILGTAVYNSEGEITSAGGEFVYGKAALTTITAFPNGDRDFWHTDWVSGCSLLINLANFASCPLFCDRYFLYYEDLDFCLRYSQQGHQIAVTPQLQIIHDTSTISDRNIYWKYKHITHSYLIHVEKYGSNSVFWLTNIRMFLNTIRLLLFKPKQGLGKLVGFYDYWQKYLFN